MLTINESMDTQSQLPMFEKWTTNVLGRITKGHILTNIKDLSWMFHIALNQRCPCKIPKGLSKCSIWQQSAQDIELQKQSSVYNLVWPCACLATTKFTYNEICLLHYINCYIFHPIEKSTIWKFLVLMKFSAIVDCWVALSNMRDNWRTWPSHQWSNLTSQIHLHPRTIHSMDQYITYSEGVPHTNKESSLFHHIASNQ